MTRHEKALAKLKEGLFIPATLLALDENRKLDTETQKKLIHYYLACGVGGIATAVHSTQFEIRDPEHALFEPVLKLVSETITEYEQANDTTIVKVAGICGETTQALQEAQLLVENGYDAGLLSPGGLQHLSEEELIERTKAVAKVIPVIAFYLQPSVGGRRFSYHYWQQICEIENVVAIKAAPFNRYLTHDVMRAAAFSSRSKDIALYTGNDDNIVVDLTTTYHFEEDGVQYESKFVGGLLGHWSVWTKTAVDMFHSLKQGMPQQDLAVLANAVTDANGAFFDVKNDFKGCIAGLHEVLRRQGLFKGIWCLNPNETLSAGQAEEIDRVLRMYPELSDDDFIQANKCNW